MVPKNLDPCICLPRCLAKLLPMFLEKACGATSSMFVFCILALQLILVIVFLPSSKVYEVIHQALDRSVL